MNIRRRFQYVLIAAALAMGWLLAPRITFAQADDHALSAILANGPYYTTERWLPVRVMCINRSREAAEGQIEFPFEKGSEKVTFILPISVPARSSHTVTAYIYVPQQPDLVSSKKGVAAEPLCTAVWRSKAGAMLSRCPILAHTIDEDADGSADRVRLDRPFIVSLVAGPDSISGLPDAATEPNEFGRLFQSTSGTRVLNITLDAEVAPRDRLGYDAAAVVLLDAAAIEMFDAGQQQALIDYMTTGGSVLLADPQKVVDPGQTWLAPYLPARWIGSRYASNLSIKTGDQTKTHKLVVPLDLAEWVADPAIDGAKIVAGDANYVHAAYQRVGLGRLIVTSFPVAGLDVKDPAVKHLWSGIFPDAPRVRWETSKLAATQSQFLESMVGLKVPPWIVAAIVVAIYVLIVLAIQLIARQTSRPVGFAAAIGVSFLIAGGLVAFAYFRDSSVELSMARITVIDLDRGGVRNEAVTLLGKDDDTFTVGTAPGASLCQVATEQSKPLTLSISPLQAGNTKVFAKRIERVWQSSIAMPIGKTLHATGQFDEKGLSLSVDNQVGAIERPQLIGQRGRFSLPDLATGTSTARADDAGLNKSAVQLEAEQLRGRILDAAMSPGPTIRTGSTTQVDDTIHLAGWLTESPPPLLQLPENQSPASMHSNAMVRTRVDLQPTPIGGKVHISKAFTQMLTGDIGAIPFDTTTGEWIEAFASQDFLVGFAFPAGIGKVKTTHVTLTMQANAPQQTITLRRGQVRNGNPQMNPGGAELAKWSQLIGTAEVEIDIEPGDVDANGWLWVMVNAEGPPTGGVAARWKIQDLSVTYDGIVEGPPQPIVMPKRELPTIDPELKPKPQQPKKPPATKAATPKKPPATKPATPKPAAAPKKESKPK